jgi:hypothetical protein
MHEEYAKVLKSRLIQQYVTEYGYSPTPEKLRELYSEALDSMPQLDVVGFSSYLASKPSFGGASSLSAENATRRAMGDDYSVVGERMSRLQGQLEDTFRASRSTCLRMSKLLGSLDGRLNNLLLLKGKADIFTYGIEETFETQDYVDFQTTDATVESNQVSIRRSGRTPVSLDSAKLSFTASSKAGIISATATTPISALKTADGQVWEYRVLTSAATGRTMCVIDIHLKEAKFISDVRLSGTAVSTNAKTVATVFYSIDGKSYKAGQSKESVMSTGENTFPIGVDGVTKLRVLLGKDAADEEYSGGYLYLFSLDSIELFADEFVSTKKSTLYLGPYEVYDEVLNPVNFSMATIASSTCCSIPSGTQVSFFLSKDGIQWSPASCSGDTPSVVSFSNLNPEGTYEAIDDSISVDRLTDNILSDMDLDFGKEAYVNLYVDSEYSDKVVIQNVTVKRNKPGNGTLYGTDSGWFFDSDAGTYSCTVYVDSIEGQWLELGGTSAYVDGRQVTGSVHLAQGYHQFKTNKTNWLSVEEDLTTLNDLRSKDRLYPYNHKYLVEGYSYAVNFSGEKVYNGFTEYFGKLCRFVAPERFYAEHDSDLGVYTVENFDGQLFFKLKILPEDNSWRSEEVEVEYMLRSDSSNQLYIKAVLTTNTTKASPRLHSIRVRVL